MRIVVMGQAAFGASTLKALLEKGEDVVAVYAPPDAPHGREDPLKVTAKEKGLPLRQPENFKDPAVHSDFRALSPDLLVMAFVTAIIPKAFLDVPTQGAICYHPSLLPRHRGASAINWAIIMGDEKTGLTIFWPDGGIDTGPILLQKEVPIGPEDTTGSLYFNHLFPMGIDAILESVDLIKRGKAPRIRQDDAQATYEPPCDDRVAGIDWSKPGKEIWNLVRGCDPQPGAYALWKGEKVRLYGGIFAAGRPEGAPGEILGIRDDHLVISLRDGVLKVAKIRTSSLGKVDSSTFMAHSGIRQGDRLS